MSEKKNNASADFAGREKDTTVVQRFITEEASPEDFDIKEKAEAAKSGEAEARAKAKNKKGAQPRYYLKNTLEDAIVDEVAASLKHISDVCKCEKCFYDICAIALNEFPSHYATSEQGELIKKATTLLNIEMRNKISQAVFNAIEMVRTKPMHDDPFFVPPVRNAPAETKKIGAIVSKPKPKKPE